jgi:hypothetical protein
LNEGVKEGRQAGRKERRKEEKEEKAERVINIYQGHFKYWKWSRSSSK